MADEFFKDETIDESQDKPEVFKVGEKEYTQEDLQKIVGLGEIAREAEEKWKTPINKVFPEYTKATQELKALKEAQLNPAPQFQQSNTNGLSQEQRDEAIRQLKDLGFVSKEEATQQVLSLLQGKDLVEDIDGLLDDAKEAGNPVTTRQDLLDHMQETGIKNPQKAYKDMFETELDAIKEKKLATIKGSGMVTTDTSTAGSKTPTNVKATKENLSQLVNEALGVS